MHPVDMVIKSINNPLTLGPAEVSKIDDAEKNLGLKFSEDYRYYLEKYGCISARGIDLTGITKDKEQNVVTVTLCEKEYNPYIPQEQYVIENLGIGGIIILQDSTGAIYITAHKRVPKKIHNNLSEYIESRKKDNSTDNV